MDDGPLEVPVKKAVRFLVEHHGKLRRFFSISWSMTDTSLYLHPQGAKSESFAGVERRLEGPFTVDFTTQLHARGIAPYLSLHETGQVHAHCGLLRTQAVEGPPLTAGHHVATVLTGDIPSLPSYDRAPKGPPQMDVVLQQGAEMLGKIVVAVFTAVAPGDLPATSKLTLNLRRPTVQQLHVGITIRGEELGATDEERSGVIALGGWNAGLSVGTAHDLVFAVALQPLSHGQRDNDAVALEWRPAHFSVGFDGYDERGMFVAQVVRYADIDHEHRHAVRGHFWRPFVHGVDVEQPGGAYTTPEAAMAAVDLGVRPFTRR